MKFICDAFCVRMRKCVLPEGQSHLSGPGKCPSDVTLSLKIDNNAGTTAVSEVGTSAIRLVIGMQTNLRFVRAVVGECGLSRNQAEA